MKAFFIAAGVLLSTQSIGQKYFSKSTRISFYSKAPLENISAVNKTAACIIDTQTGLIQCSVLIKSFEFPKALMQEHFNENYLESDKYPKSEFKGSIVNNGEINYEKPGTYTAKIKGQLTIHGVTREIETTGSIIIGAGVDIACDFIIKLSDYNISIPALVKDNISNNVKVSISSRMEPLK